MIIDFFIEPSAVREDDGASLATREFIRAAIDKFGCQAGSSADWISIIKALPQIEKKKWIETLRRAPRRPGKSVSEVDGPSELDRGSDFDAFVVLNSDRIHGWLVEISESGSEVPAWLADQNIEITNCEKSVLSELVRKRDDWRSERIEGGIHRDEVWRTRIGPVVSCANKLVIVDRYFMSIMRRADRGIQSARGGGAYWLFNMIGRSSSISDPMEIVIYCSDAGEPALSSMELSNLAATLLESAEGGISNLTVIVSPDRLFGQIEHDRYWRIWTGNKSLTLTFGSSVDLFDNERLVRSSNFSYSVDRAIADDSRTVEQQLEKVSIKLKASLGNENVEFESVGKP
jgi:hypothetical protein